MTDLASLLIRAIEEQRERVARAELAYPDEPIQVVLDWHPATRAVRLAVRTTDNAPPFRLDAA